MFHWFYSSTFYRFETQLGELYQHINDTAKLRSHDHAEPNNTLTERLVTLENTISRLSIRRKAKGRILRGHDLVNIMIKSQDCVRGPTDPSTDPNLSRHHLSSLSRIVAAKASVQTLIASLEAFFENVIWLNQEMRYWEDVLEADWRVGLYTLQISPFRAWQRLVGLDERSSHGPASPRPTNNNRSPEARPNSAPWLQYTSIQACLNPSIRSFRIGLSSLLRETRSDIEWKMGKLRVMRDFNVSAIGLLTGEYLMPEADFPMATGREITDRELFRTVRVSVGALEVILRNAGHEIALFQQALNAVGNGAKISPGADPEVETDSHDYQDIIQQLIYIHTNLLPRYKRTSAGHIVESGRPSTTVRYWLPLSLALFSATTSLKIARDAGPIVVGWVSSFGVITLDFWRNWVVDPMRKLIRTIRHDEKSEIALMSKNSLEADRASLERMVVDFVLDRSEQSQSISSSDAIVGKVREGDLTPVLMAYEKDLRSPFVGTFRGDLVRALLIQIQKTKVDVEVAMSGIDALLRSQELVFGYGLWCMINHRN